MRTLSSAGLCALAPVLAVRWPCFSFLVTICCLPAIGFGLCARQGHGVRHVHELPWGAAVGCSGALPRRRSCGVPPLILGERLVLCPALLAP